MVASLGFEPSFSLSESDGLPLAEKALSPPVSILLVIVSLPLPTDITTTMVLSIHTTSMLCRLAL